jgi:hypothetical protein
MPRFRHRSPQVELHQDKWPSFETAQALVAEALRPCHFFAAPGTRVETQHTDAEEVFWEILQGRLLDAPMTTRRQSFEAWHVHVNGADERPTEPLISVLLDSSSGYLYVIRSIYCHAWEGYHAGDNVFLSRETRKWMRELVGTIRLAQCATADALHDELIGLLFHAVVGTSRLPLTSVESPMPAYSLGQLTYVFRPTLDATGKQPMHSCKELIEHGLHAHLIWKEQAKLLETIIRAIPRANLADEAENWLTRWRELGRANEEVLPLLRSLFNEVALSPYTDFVDKSLAFLDVLERIHRVTAEGVSDFLGHLLRQLGRHLTAYDLVIFHHRGANYPDALFLDAVLKALLKRIEQRPDLFKSTADEDVSVQRVKRLRRRGLRQAWIMRAHYEGHPVPDAPTSEGENTRVLPAPYVRVPEEQITQTRRRTKRLYADDSLSTHLGQITRDALNHSIADLEHTDELRELGMALFLDRPLGIGKAPGEPDQTLLFSYEAFSRSIAERRLGSLSKTLNFLDTKTHQRFVHQLRSLPVRGIALDSLHFPERLSPVSLADARKAADDWLFLRNTRQTTSAFHELYDCKDAVTRFALECFNQGRRFLMLNGFGQTDEERASITVFDDACQPRLRLAVDASDGYERHGVCEFPSPGLRVTQAWDASGKEMQGVEFGIIIRAQS